MSGTGRRRHDRIADQPTEELGIRALQKYFGQLDAQAARVDALRVTERSSLAGDDLATPYMPVTSLFIGRLAVATDHLRGVQVAVQDSGWKVTAMSMFTLIRSAYESAAVAVWLLAPTSRDDRVLRALQLAVDARKSLHTVQMEAMGADERYASVLAKLERDRDARPALIGARLDKLPSITARIKEATPHLPVDFLPPITLWRLASGIAHGNMQMMRTVLEHKQLEDFGTDRTAHFRMTTSVGTLAMFYVAAFDMVTAAVELYEQRNISPLESAS